MSSAQDLIKALSSEGEKSYASYSSQIYLTKHLTLAAPEVTSKFHNLEESAKSRLRPEAFDYVAGGCSTEKTMQANLSAFDHWCIVPRMMRSVQPVRDYSRTIFGRLLPAPIVMAPIGVQSLMHPDGELASAKVFGEMGLPFTLSTAASKGMKSVAEANGNSNPRWYQLYWPSDNDLTRSFLDTAKHNGYDVLVVTLDTWQLSWRPRDLDTGFFPFVQGIGTQIGLEDKCAHEKLGFDALAPGSTQEQKAIASLFHVLSTTRGISPRWENLKLLRELWGEKPIVLKGIQSVADAKLALEYGMDGIIVSNHGGRQVNGAIGSLRALPKIVDAVGGRMTIGFDSGIRCGADIFKALALGADFVQLGRPILWGLAHEGEKGARHVLRSLLADFDLTVGLSGCRGLSDIDRSCLATEDGEELKAYNRD